MYGDQGSGGAGTALEGQRTFVTVPPLPAGSGGGRNAGRGGREPGPVPVKSVPDGGIPNIINVTQSGKALGENPHRKYLLIQNKNATPANWCEIGVNFAPNAGGDGRAIRLEADQTGNGAGGSYERAGDWVPRGEIFITGTNLNVVVWEA